MHFTASRQELPESIKLKAKLAWHYYYRGYELIRTSNNYILVAKNNKNLDEAIAFSSESDLISHLEMKTDEAMTTDKAKFFRSFVMFPELLNQNVITALEQNLNSNANTQIDERHK